MAAFDHNLRHVYAVRGHSHAAIREAEEERHLALITADRETLCWARYGRSESEARLGRLEAAHRNCDEARAAIAGRNSLLSESILENHIEFVRLQASDYREAAAAAAERGRAIHERTAFHVEYVVYCYPILLEALVGPDWTTPRRDATIRVARRASCRSRFFGCRFPNVRPRALRVHGRLLCSSNDPKRAERCFRKSLDAARAIGAEYDEARALFDLAAVRESQAPALRADAIDILRRLDAVGPRAEAWSLGDAGSDGCIAPSWKARSG